MNGTDSDSRPADNGLGSLIGQLVEDTEKFVKAEIGLYQAEAAYRVAELRKYLLFGLIGVMFAIAGFFFLLLAAVYGLATVIGLPLAALAVAGSAILLAAILFGIIAARMKRGLRGDG